MPSIPPRQRCVATILVAVALAGCSAAASKPTAQSGMRAPASTAPSTTDAPSRSNEPRDDLLGGSSVVIIEAPSYAVMAALATPEAYWRVLPHVVSITDCGPDGDDQVLEVVHGLGLFRGGYVLRVRRDWDADGRHLIRFWIDTRFPRDVDDAWGWFDIRSLGPSRTELRYNVRASLLPGIIRWLFAEKIQWALMSVPDRARAFVEDAMRRERLRRRDAGAAAGTDTRN